MFRKNPFHVSMRAFEMNILGHSLFAQKPPCTSQIKF